MFPVSRFSWVLWGVTILQLKHKAESRTIFLGPIGRFFNKQQIYFTFPKNGFGTTSLPNWLRVIFCEPIFVEFQRVEPQERFGPSMSDFQIGLIKFTQIHLTVRDDSDFLTSIPTSSILQGFLSILSQPRFASTIFWNRDVWYAPEEL